MHRNPILRLCWCMVGAGAAISLALFLAGPNVAPFLLASLGGSTVFLFGLTQAPAAQPRALFGGHLGVRWLVLAVIKRLAMRFGCLPSLKC